MPFSLRFEQRLPHRSPIIPAATQLWPLEDLTFLLLLLLRSLLPLLFACHVLQILLLELRCYTLVRIAVGFFIGCVGRMVVYVN